MVIKDQQCGQVIHSLQTAVPMKSFMVTHVAAAQNLVVVVGGGRGGGGLQICMCI